MQLGLQKTKPEKENRKTAHNKRKVKGTPGHSKSPKTQLTQQKRLPKLMMASLICSVT
jgi:hypothetical protein